MTRLHSAALLAAALLMPAHMAAQPPAPMPVTRSTTSLPDAARQQTSGSRAPSTPLALPYTETFSDPAALGSFYVRDANFDGTTWKVAAEQLRIQANNAKAMNDWVITAPINLEAGKEYEFSFDARAHNSYYPEKIRAALGTAPEASEMTVILLPETTLTETDYRTFAMKYTPAVSGTYYFGLHGCSDAGSFYLWADNIRISATAPPTAPAEPALSGLPDYDRRLQAEFTIVAPDTDIDGNPLDGLTKIVLMREGTPVHTIDNPEPGQAYTCDDTLPPGSDERYYTYSAIPYNGATAGREATMQMFMGVNLPGPAKNARALEDNNSGYIVVTWDKADTDIDGYPMNPSLIHYVVYSNNGELLDEDITDNFCAAQYLTLTQRYHFYIVMSETSAGLNDRDFPQSNMVALGTPYTLPFAESFADGKLSTAFAIEYNEGGRLEQTATAEALGATPADDDNGMLVYTSGTDNSAALLMAGKISIGEDAVNPVLTYQYFKTAGSPDRITVAINESPYFDMENFEDVHTVNVADGTDGWNRVTVPLTDYKGTVIKPAFRFIQPAKGSAVAIDDIRLFDQLDHNLKVRSASAPHKVYANNPLVFDIEIENIGAMEADGYTVSLLCDGQTVASVPGDAITSGSRAAMKITHIPSVLAPAQSKYHMTVDYAPDMDPGDNTSRQFDVITGTTPLPRAGELSATPSDGAISLTWQAVDLATATCEVFTEDFEDYAPFEIDNAGDWTLLDLDGAATWGISGMDFPNEQNPMAFIVFNTTGYHSTMDARSGLQYLAAMSSRGGVSSDDWLISPPLCGNSQEISFYVSSQSTSYGNERFQVLTSRSGTATTDFTPLYSNDKVPAIEWARHTCTLPDGTRHFAIRSYDTNLMFRIDDISFIPALPELRLLGYNVYRDGERITSSPLTQPSYTDPQESDGSHTYCVTAVYDKGESRPSDAVTADYTALPAIGLDDTPQIAVNGTTVNCSVPFEIHDLMGRLRAVSPSPGSLTLPAGIYLVKAGAHTAKVLLR